MNSLIWNPNKYQSFQSSSKVQEFTNNRAASMEPPRTSWPTPPSKVCTCAQNTCLTQSHLHPGNHLLLLFSLSFFLFKADKLRQVFPSYLDTKIKSLPNYWLLSSPAGESEPAPESCSPKPSWGEVVFISGTRLRFLETKHSRINREGRKEAVIKEHLKLQFES